MGLPQITYPPCISLSQVIALVSLLHCNVACINIISSDIHYAFIYCCAENVGKYIRTAGTCEFKHIRYYIDYSQASLTTMETSPKMLCVILA